VVAAAAEVADEVGWDRLTLAAVADRLGVRLPSLYKHVSSLDGLRQGVATLAVGELAGAVTAAAVGKSGGDALQAFARAYREYARAHPGRYAATLRAPEPGALAHTAAADRLLRVVFAVLAGFGIADDDAVHVTRALRAALHGFVALEQAGGFGMPEDVDESFRRLLGLFSGWLHECT
jgi:AcrR family transcriptional regulator